MKKLFSYEENENGRESHGLTVKFGHMMKMFLMF